MSEFWENEDTLSEQEANKIIEKSQQELLESEAVMVYDQKSGEIDDPVVYEDEVEESEEISEEESEILDDKVLKDASLRLEQGNLYKMLLKHNLFEDVDADERAVNNVQREMRAFIRERLEVLVGLKEDPRIQKKKVSVEGQLSGVELAVLKQFLSKAVSAQTEGAEDQQQRPVRQGSTKLSPVVGNTKKSNVRVVTKAKPQKGQQRAQSAPQEEPRLTKSPKDMSPAELLEYNKSVAARQAGKKAMAVGKKIPMPDTEQVNMLYAQRTAQSSGQAAGGFSIAAMVSAGGKTLNGAEYVGDGSGYSDDPNERF